MQHLTKLLSVALVFLMLYSATSHANSNYKLGAGDTIRINVYNEEDLSMEYLVSSSGQIEYPYLGKLKVLGQTAEQLQQTITQGLEDDYLIDPKVSVNVVQYRMIYVNGEVAKPGGYNFQPGLTVEKAIALAGGFTERASTKGIRITPSSGGEELSRLPLTYKVSPGDIIIVKASFF